MSNKITTKWKVGAGMLAVVGIAALTVAGQAFAFDAPSYCTPPSGEGYYAYTASSTYQQGQSIDLCIADNTRSPLFYQGTHPWQVTDQNGNVVYTPPAGMLASTTGSDYFTDTWNGQDASGTPLMAGTYHILFAGAPGAPQATFTIAASTSGNGNGTNGSSATGTTTGTVASSSSLTDLIQALKNLQASYPSYQYQIGGLITELSAVSGGSGSGSTAGASVDQNSGAFIHGGSIDLVGRNFAPNQSVRVTLGGSQVATAFADGGGNFSTGTIALPTTAGTYTYTFTESGGYSTSATITVQ